MRKAIVIAVLAFGLPAQAQERAPDPVVIVEDTRPVATGVVVGLIAVLVLAAALAGAGD